MANRERSKERAGVFLAEQAEKTPVALRG